VAQAVVKALILDARGTTFEIAGQDVFTNRQLSEWIQLVLKMPTKVSYDLEPENELHQDILWYVEMSNDSVE
jgi:hypothetical protein